MYKRIQYATDPNICLISHKYYYDRFQFSIQGSYESVYDVIFNTSGVWNCTCLDFVERNKWCKHIYYVLLQVLKMNLPPDESGGTAMRYGHRCSYARKRTRWFKDMCDTNMIQQKYFTIFPK